MAQIADASCSDDEIEVSATCVSGGRYDCFFELEVCSEGGRRFLLHRWAYDVTQLGLASVAGQDMWRRYGRAIPGEVDTIRSGGCLSIELSTRFTEWLWSQEYHPERPLPSLLHLDNPVGTLKWRHDIHDETGSLYRQLEFYAVEWDAGEPWPAITGASGNIDGHRVSFEMTLDSPVSNLAQGTEDTYNLFVRTAPSYPDQTTLDLDEWHMELKSAWIMLLSTDSVIVLDPPSAAWGAKESEFLIEGIHVPFYEDRIELACEVVLRNDAAGKETLSTVLRRPLLLISPRYFVAPSEELEDSQ